MVYSLKSHMTHAVSIKANTRKPNPDVGFVSGTWHDFVVKKQVDSFKRVGSVQSVPRIFESRRIKRWFGDVKPAGDSPNRSRVVNLAALKKMQGLAFRMYTEIPRSQTNS